ncbi:MAG: MMPL family transporter [Actinomycetota bacterium]|nr:MMPL family transporter [Actinomycetota bacterium]
MRIVRIIFGILGILVGAALVAGAVTTLTEERDADDFFVSDGHRFERSSFAITSEGVDVLADAPGWVADRLTDPVDVRVRGASNDGSSLFLGIAASKDLEAYLAEVPYDEVEQLEFEGSRIDYVHHAGTSVPGAPGTETLWVTSVEGLGVQTLDWSVEQGDWTVVVMNADGSAGVDANLVLGARISNIVGVMWGALALGLISMLGGGLLAFRGLGKPRAEPTGVSDDIRGRKRDRRIAQEKGENVMGQRFFEWVNRRYALITVGVLILAVLMAGAFSALGSDEEPQFDPSGEIYDTADRVEEVFDFTGGTSQLVFLVEGPDEGDVLTRNALLEWKTNSERLRAATRDVGGDPLNSHLTTAFHRDLNVEIANVYSIADAVDAELAGGLEGASDADVKVALATVLAPNSPNAALRGTLSRLTTVTPGTVAGQEIEVWEGPAFQALVVYDLDTFEVTTTSTDQDVIDQERFLEVQRWARQVQIELRGDQEYYTALGLGIDIDLAFEEQAAEAMPFILGAVVVIVIVVGALLRSYWAAVYVGAALTVSTIIYKGIWALVGLKGGMLLGFIVPISVISFGVDFFIHAIGRAREAQVEGHSRERAYPIGLSAVMLALLLAALSSSAAFLSNAVSGIETITQFGVGAAIAILVAFVVLGLLTPKLVLATEEGMGSPPEYHGPRIPTKFGFLLAALVAGVTVAGAVQFPTIGVVALLVYATLFIWLPFRWTRRRNKRAADKGIAPDDTIKGVGHGLHAAGYVVHFLARWRVVTIPVVVVLAVAGVWGALQVRSDFSFTDFLSSDSDAVKSFERQEFHFGALGVGTGYIYVEGDLTPPTTLQAMQVALDEVTNSGVDFSRDFNGEVEVVPNAVTLAQFATISAAAAGDVEAGTGVEITDTDGDGYPDTPQQVAAIYATATRDGLRDDTGQIVYTSETVQRILYLDGDTQGTRLEVVIGSLTDGPLIDASQVALEEAAASLTTATAGADVVLISVSGEPITFRNTLNAFTKSMLLSLPLALVLTFLIVAWMLRSVRYALVSVIPILLVVAWVYGFMYLANYTINPVTATIAAISIGVGIDFATHFTVRFREELAGEPSRFPALRRAGEGTGGALTLSALTSIAGFTVLGMAPMPIFAVYGVLTAVMIALAVLVTLLVLPSLLLFVTPSLKGEEREQLEWERTRGEWVYEPHKRETATQER